MTITLSRNLLTQAARLGVCTAALAGLSAHAGVVVDGQTGDWASISPVATAASQTVRSLKVTVENQAVFILAEGQAFSGNYNLYLDTDTNAATGHQSHLWPEASGAEYLVSNGSLYKSTGTGWSWAPSAGDIQTAAHGTAVEIKIALNALGVAAGGVRLSLGFQAVTPDWGTDSVLPKATRLASYTNAGPAFPVGKGLIVPAYVPLADAYSWNILKEAAALVATGTNPAFRDFWVTVNSATSGPFSSAADWAKAATVWDPIRLNGGRIFGYVHTCLEPVGPHFRPLATVKSEIAAWVNGYPKLDGIWLDEYYPRFEIAESAVVPGPTYPNGLANAPADRGFVNVANQFNGQQVIPAGGYYDQLVQWIRTTYPSLRIIGNAGGAFYSNQLKYSDLPDVLVSFEQNFETAANAPIYDWATLNRQVPNSQSGQLALIHRNTSSLATAVDQALSRGYTHVYTTDRQLENNIWGGLPPYFMSEVQYLANHP